MNALTRGEKILFVVCWLLVIASRVPALSRTLLDWDETLFSFGVREYDVSVHHPHPPGYPLFIVAAKALRPIAGSEFRALQAVATLFSALLFPAAFLLARALKLRTSAAFAAALFTSFLPTIWYHGGTALSDVPALCLALFASALLLRGTPRAYLAGCIVAALASGVRPQTLLIIAIPALFGVRRPKSPLSIALAATLVILTYVGAAYFSKDFPHGYLDQVKVTSKHIHDTDSIGNVWRTPLRELAPKALWFPFAGGRARWLILGFSVIAIVWTAAAQAAALARARSKSGSLRYRSPEVGILLLMFVPTALMTWLFLDPSCIPRYAVAYAPLFAFLAAIGIAATFGRFAVIPIVVITAMLINWTRPALTLVHDAPSPPVAAFDWVRTNVPRVGPRVFIENELALHAEYLLADYDYKLVFEPRDIRAEDMQPGNVFVVEGESIEHDARVFKRPRKELWMLARTRYFETSVIPMHTMTWFLDGWYEPEGGGENGWRWMGSKAGVYLPTLSRNGELRMKFYVPVDTTPRPPIITVTWNGAVVDRVRAPNPEIELHYTLASRSGLPNELGISVDVWANPARDRTGNDARDLGLKLLSMSWEAAPLQ